MACAMASPRLVPRPVPVLARRAVTQAVPRDGRHGPAATPVDLDEFGGLRERWQIGDDLSRSRVDHVTGTADVHEAPVTAVLEPAVVRRRMGDPNAGHIARPRQRLVADVEDVHVSVRGVDQVELALVRRHRNAVTR